MPPDTDWADLARKDAALAATFRAALEKQGIRYKANAAPDEVKAKHEAPAKN